MTDFRINDIDEVKDIMVTLSKLKPSKSEEFDFIVHHPFTQIPVFTVSAHDNKLLPLFENLDLFYEQLEKDILSRDSVNELFYMLSRPYRMFALYNCQNCLSVESFSELLAYIYKDTEFPNKDKNVSVKTLIEMFRYADQSYIMEEEELVSLNRLDDEITVYRGFYSEKYYKALSWTTSLTTAKFFSKRFSKDGRIYKATISKKDIFAFWENENEIVLNPNKLKKVQLYQY